MPDSEELPLSLSTVTFSHIWQEHWLTAAPRDQTLEVSSWSSGATFAPFCRWEERGFRQNLWRLCRANSSHVPWVSGDTIFWGWHEAFWSFLTAQIRWWSGSLTFIQPLLYGWMKHFWPPRPTPLTEPPHQLPPELTPACSKKSWFKVSRSSKPTRTQRKIF